MPPRRSTRASSSSSSTKPATPAKSASIKKSPMKHGRETTKKEHKQEEIKQDDEEDQEEEEQVVDEAPTKRSKTMARSHSHSSQCLHPQIDVAAHLESHLGEMDDGGKHVANTEDEKKIFICSFRSSLGDGIDTFASLGLSHVPLETKDGSIIFQELVFSRARGKSRARDLASLDKKITTLLKETCYYIMYDQQALVDGQILYPGQKKHNETITLKLGTHTFGGIYVTHPIHFGETFVNQKNVHMIWLIPITADEVAYAKKNGSPALDEQLQQADIELFQLNRKSVV